MKKCPHTNIKRFQFSDSSVIEMCPDCSHGEKARRLILSGVREWDWLTIIESTPETAAAICASDDSRGYEGYGFRAKRQTLTPEKARAVLAEAEPVQGEEGYFESPKTIEEIEAEKADDPIELGIEPAQIESFEEELV